MCGRVINNTHDLIGMLVLVMETYIPVKEKKVQVKIHKFCPRSTHVIAICQTYFQAPKLNHILVNNRKETCLTTVYCSWNHPIEEIIRYAKLIARNLI